MWRRIQTLGLVAVLFAAGCGYRLAGNSLGSGKGLTLAVPTFTNATTVYRIEQRLTRAVRRELIRSTDYSVVPAESGDLVVTGSVLGFSATPVIFNSEGRGSTYSIAVEMNIRLLDTRTNTVLFQNDRWTFRDVFELAQESDEFVPEDGPALERLAQRFASLFVASIMHRNP